MKFSKLPIATDLTDLFLIGTIGDCMYKVRLEDIGEFLCGVCGSSIFIDTHFKYTISPVITEGYFNTIDPLQDNYPLEEVKKIRLSKISIHNLSIEQWFNANDTPGKILLIRKLYNPNIFGLYKITSLEQVDDKFEIELVKLAANGNLEQEIIYQFQFYNDTYITNIGEGIELVNSNREVRSLKPDNSEIDIYLNETEDEVHFKGTPLLSTGDGIAVFPGRNDKDFNNPIRSIGAGNEEIEIGLSENKDRVNVSGTPINNIGEGEHLFKERNKQTKTNDFYTLLGQENYIEVKPSESELEKQIALNEKFKEDLDDLIELKESLYSVVWIWPFNIPVPDIFEEVPISEWGGLGLRIYKEGDPVYGVVGGISGSDTFTIKEENLPSFDIPFNDNAGSQYAGRWGAGGGSATQVLKVADPDNVGLLSFHFKGTNKLITHTGKNLTIKLIRLKPKTR